MTGDALVVGGGVAGLVAGYDLAIAGHRVTVVEASQRVGGTVSSYEIDGLKVDVGAESFATATGVVQRLINDLGLAAEVVQPRTGAAWIQHLSGAAPLPAGGWLGIPARPWASDVRRVIGWPGSVRALADLGLPFNVGRSSGSIGGLVSARLGQRVLNRLVEPVVGGVYSTAPADLAFQRLPIAAREALREERSLAKVAATVRSGAAAAGSQVAGLRGGMSRLVDALVDGLQQHGGSLVTGVAVSALRREDGRWRVSAQSHTWTVDAVVLATPADATLALLGEPAPLAPVSSVLLCTIVVNQPELDSAPRGSGLLVAAGVPQIAAKALTHATAKWAWLGEAAGPGRHVLRLSYGRIGDRTLPDHAAFPRLAVADAARLLGVPIRMEQLSGWTVNRWPVTGAAAAVPPAAPDGIAITGGWVAGTGLAAVVGHSRTQTAQVLNHLAGRSVLAGPLPH